MKLRTKASVVMAVTVTLALVTIGGVFHLFLEQSLRASLHTGLVGVANTAVESVRRFVKGSLRDARAVAAGLSPQVIASRDTAAAEAHLARMYQIFPQFDNGLFILDAKGELWADYPRHEAVRGVSFAFREYFQQTVQTRQGVVGRPYESARSKEPVCTFTAPLLDAQGNLVGLVGCSVKLLGDEALSVLRRQAIGETGYLYIIDQTRLMIMHPVNERILQRDSPPGANLLFDRALQGFEGVGDTVNSRGVPMVAAFKRVPETDWILVVQQPWHEALAPLRDMRVRLAWGVLVGALLAVLVGLWVVKRITKPIVELSQATAGLAREPLPPDNPALERADEIGDLARSFREISQDLHRTFSELREAEVRLSTAQGVAHIGSWELDLATGLMWGSEEAIRIYGLSATPPGRLPLEALRGVPLEEYRPRLDQAMADLLAGRGGYSLEIRIRRPVDGQIRDLYTQATLLPGQNGAPGKVVGVIQDITERQRADADIRRQAEELTALNALSHDLNRDLSLRHTVRAALQGLMETLHPDMAFLFLRQGESLVLQDALPDGAGAALAAVGEHQVGQCVCGLAASEARSLFSQDIDQDSRCTWSECKAAGIRSMAAVPFSSEDQVIGVIGLASRTTRDFQGQSAFLETFAGHVSVAITNARLFEKVQRDLQEHQRTLAALNKSQDRYRALSHQSPLGISLIAPDGRYEYLNTAFTDMFGYTLEDIPTREDWFRLAYPDEDYRQDVVSRWTDDVKTIQPGRSVTRTLRVTTRDGVLKDILLRVVALFSGGHFVIYEDISERLRAEEALRQSEERFRQFVERSPVPIVIINAKQELEYSNPKFTQIYGYERGYFPSIEVWWERAYPDPEYRQEVKISWLNRVDQARATGSDVAHLERNVRCRDGSYKTVSFYGAPVGDKIMVVLLDVTAERQAAQALLDSETRFRRFVETTPVGIHMYRHLGDGRLEFAGFNPAADRILGLDHRQLLGKTIEEAFPALLDTDVPQRYLRVAEHGEVWRSDNVSYEHGRVSGAYELTAFQTTPGSMAVMFNDITQRLQVQEDLRILEQQLVRSQKLEALGTLASGIAHDFNNILQALHGRVQLLAGDQGLPETTRRHIDNMQRSIVRASNLVARMLSFSRKGGSNLSVLEINAEVLSAMEMLSHALPKMVELQTDLAPDAGSILGDANRLEQVLLNLATNARDAMPEGGSLLLRTRRRQVAREAESTAGLAPGDYVVLEISDTGQGMDTHTLTHIFEPFFSTKDPGKGTGLGLYSAFGIIRDHNGTITCQSKPGHGTTFTVIFPRVSAQEALDQAAAPEASDQVAGDGEAILVVDDEPEVLEPLAEALLAYGYRVHRATSGEEALASLEVPGLLIDLVLMDLNMPGMGGERALAEIKATYPEVLVVVTSGYQDRALKMRLMGQGGADHFIGKPFNFKELLVALRQVLGKRHARA